MKTLSGDYHPLFSTGFLKYFTINLKLTSLHHVLTTKSANMPSLHPDRNAIAIDPFSISSWSKLNFYAFPPASSFQPIGAAIAKVRKEKCSGIIIIPWWKTVLVSHDGIITKKFPDTSPNTLTLPSKRSAKHPLYLKMKLLAVRAYHEKLRKQTFHTKRNYGCYHGFVENNHPKSVRTWSYNTKRLVL